MEDPTLTVAMPERLPGPFVAGERVAGRFLVEREIAEGGMGFVYLALDEKLHQPRALKVAKLGFGSHLPPEARSALRVTHPNVCRVYEIHTAETAHGPVDFLSMEFVDGGTLSRRLKDHGPFPEPEARALAEQICAGLGAAHGQNLLHRDLKSNNVLLAKDGRGGFRAVVTDFGLAQEPTAAETGPLATGVAGTPEYLAPERWRGERATIATDIYALGIVLHELITGRRPHKEKRTISRKIPARWRAVITRCLEEDPKKRYGSAAEVAEALTGRAARRRRLWAAAAAVVVIGAILWKVLNPGTPPARLAIVPLEAPGASAEVEGSVRGGSYDLSGRLQRLRPRPPQLVVIPMEETRNAAGLRERLGATHLLRGTVTQKGSRLVLRGAVIDLATQVALRETTAEFDAASAGAVAETMAALAAAALHLPRQTKAESIAAGAYREYAAGMAHLRSNTQAYAKAVAAFERAKAQDPASPLPRAGLAEACYSGWLVTADSQWLQRGREELARAVAMNPDSLVVHLANGKLNLVPGAYERAAQEYQRAIQLDGASAEAWRGLARAYENMEGRRSEAADAYRKAMELQPGYYSPLLDFGDFHRRMGNYQEAEKHWKRATEIAPQSINAHSNLGGLYADMGRWEDAERELQRALAIDNRSRSVMNNLASLYQYMGRDADAVKVLERARTLGPESHILALNLGDSYRRLGNAPAAREAYGRARLLAEKRLLDNPGDAPMRAFVAYFMLRLGERATAERELLQAVRFAPKDRTVIRRAVISYEALGKRDRALEVLQAATPDVLKELNRQPDLVELRRDPRFAALLPKQQ